MDLNTPVRYIKGIGEKRSALFAKLGIETVGNLLDFFPRVYEDWSKVTAIRDTVPGETCCVRVTAGRVNEYKIRKGMTLYKGNVTDGIFVMKLTIFNNKYAAERLKEGEEFLLFGKVTGNLLEREMVNPAIVKAQGGDRIRPVYRQTQSLTSLSVEKAVRAALDGTKEQIQETLSDDLRQKYTLCTVCYAYENIHFPKSDYALTCARRRLIFEELLILQLGLFLLRGRNKRMTGYVMKKDETDTFFSLLPFTPTNAQRKAVKEAAADMKTEVPMNRLIQGDVGSGKTAVAAALIYTCAKNGMQSALMAPTEILAVQHYKTLCRLLKGTGISVALLTGSLTAAEKRAVKQKLADGEISLAVGTHALIQKDVAFRNLGLVVTDEQHRFGVEQRNSLMSKGKNPHTLVMSATPIPRTLALIIYGDLDVSVLDELPAGRQKIETYKIGSKLHERAMNYVKKHLDSGKQGYIVCPLVEEGETDLKAAEEYYVHLSQNVFKGYTVGLLHGKMKAKDKDAVMRDFAEGKIQLLVSTTVIEVGVDVPNAVIMVIENAERFGLSQLHQLRGRVGRGKDKSTCILVSDAQNEEAVKRLEIMCRTSDGFQIADADLQMRGPGDFFGARQHGLPELKIADMLKDLEVLRETQASARMILDKDPKLVRPEHAQLREKVEALFESVGANTMN